MAASALFKAFPGSGRPTAPLVEFVKDTVYYTICPTEPAPRDSVVFFCIDSKLHYNSFYLDFGPHNLGSTFQFCAVMNKMVDAVSSVGGILTKRRRQIHFYSSPDPHLRANAVCLLACWGVLYRGMTPSQAFAPFAFMSFPSFHDASPTTCEYRLTILDCLHGLARALHHQYIHPATFDLVEYHHYEQVDHGDLTWISPKLLAFAGPQHDHAVSPEGYVTLPPEHFVPHFKKKGVSLVVRLNEPLYDAGRFTRAGIAHLDLFYPDGANPPESILAQFLQACEQTPGSVAVHCKAGLGRTGTCIAAYMMKHHRFSAKEAIGWLRLCRPGSVIGPQQEYLESIQAKMWHLGDAMNSVRLRPEGFTLKMAGGGASVSSSTTATVTTTSPVGSPRSPRSPGHGRLLTTRAINIYGGRRSIDLSASAGVGMKAADLAAVAAAHDERRAKKMAVSQGDHLLRRKQQNHNQAFVRSG